MKIMSNPRIQYKKKKKETICTLNYNGHLEREIRVNTEEGVRKRRREKKRVQNVKREEIN